MTHNQARIFLIKHSFLATGIFGLFFILSPFLGYRLTTAESYSLFSTVLPIFVGYLSMAVAFLALPGDSRREPKSRRDMLALILRGAFVAFYIFMISLLIIFQWSNRSQATIGTGMTFDDLSKFITFVLSFLTATVGSAVGFLFKTEVASEGGQ